jgi:lysozyme
MIQSNNGVDFIKKEEGVRYLAYDDLNPTKTLKAGDIITGTLTIGYGHTKGVYIGQKINEAQATNFLLEDLYTAQKAVFDAVKVPITQNMLDALVSFAFNVGSDAFKGSTLLKKVNLKDFTAAALEFPKWIYSKKQVVSGLVKRRANEKALFEKAMFVCTYAMPTKPNQLKKNVNSNLWLLITLALGLILF